MGNILDDYVRLWTTIDVEVHPCRSAGIHTDVMAWEDRSGRIDHDGPVTVWQQVAGDITTDIESGELSPGSRLPSEAELAELYGVARGTVRRALAALVDSEAITVVHGRGTFVAAR